MSDTGAAGRSGGAVGTYRTTLEWIDTDAAGIYHNSTVLRFVEAAEAALMAERGLLQEYFPVAPRVRFQVEFRAPLFFGQQVTTTVRIARLGRSSMTYRFEVWGEELDARPRRLAAEGEYVVVCIAGRHGGSGADSDPDEGAARSVPWPDAWVEALSTEPDQAESTP